jgi:hypothetical protein
MSDEQIGAEKTMSLHNLQVLHLELNQSNDLRTSSPVYIVYYMPVPYGPSRYLVLMRPDSTQLSSESGFRVWRMQGSISGLAERGLPPPPLTNVGPIPQHNY